MIHISVDFTKENGSVKPMYAVNNGPVYKFAVDQRITNIDAFREAGIPYPRNHDASFFATYGGEHTVDVHASFPNFDAYKNDPHYISNKIQLVPDFWDQYGFSETKSILNEWNYVRGWTGDDWYYSLKAEKA